MVSSAFVVSSSRGFVTFYFCLMFMAKLVLRPIIRRVSLSDLVSLIRFFFYLVTFFSSLFHLLDFLLSYLVINCLINLFALVENVFAGVCFEFTFRDKFSLLAAQFVMPVTCHAEDIQGREGAASCQPCMSPTT